MLIAICLVRGEEFLVWCGHSVGFVDVESKTASPVYFKEEEKEAAKSICTVVGGELYSCYTVAKSDSARVLAEFAKVSRAH